MLIRILFIALALTACAVNHQALPHQEACQEQADAWCSTVAPAAPGCWVVYHRWCDGEAAVPWERQEACLDAIGEMTPTLLGGYPVPGACAATFRGGQ